MSANKIKAIVVDDEAHARDLMKGVLGLFEHTIEIVDEAENLPGAVRKIQELQPKVVFLDIDMPKFSGLQIKEFITDEVLIVYVTAHSQHAIEALRLEAFDYLLKPIDIDGLKKCVARIEQYFQKHNEFERKSALVLEQKITVNTQQGTHFVSKNDIFYIEAAAMYAVIHFEKDQLIVSKPLKEFSYLEANDFFRIHRSFLVNTKKVKRFSTIYGSEVILENGSVVPVSRSAKENFMRFMKKGEESN